MGGQGAAWGVKGGLRKRGGEESIVKGGVAECGDAGGRRETSGWGSISKGSGESLWGGGEVGGHVEVRGR